MSNYNYSSGKRFLQALAHGGETDIHIRSTTGVGGLDIAEHHGIGGHHNHHGSFRDNWLGGLVTLLTLKFITSTLGLILIVYLFWHTGARA